VAWREAITAPLTGGLRRGPSAVARIPGPKRPRVWKEKCGLGPPNRTGREQGNIRKVTGGIGHYPIAWHWLTKSGSLTDGTEGGITDPDARKWPGKVAATTPGPSCWPGELGLLQPLLSIPPARWAVKEWQPGPAGSSA